MFKFANPEYLYLLVLVPVLVALHVFSNIRRRMKLSEYGDRELISRLMPDASVSRPNIKFWLLFACYTLCCFLLARPQFGSKQETVTRRGIETVIALDISNSMLEALALGLPSVVTDCPAGGARLAIQDRENGMLIPTGDEQALYTAMKYMLENPEEASRMGNNAAKIRERWPIEKIADRWLELF